MWALIPMLRSFDSSTMASPRAPRRSLAADGGMGMDSARFAFVSRRAVGPDTPPGGARSFCAGRSALPTPWSVPALRAQGSAGGGPRRPPEREEARVAPARAFERDRRGRGGAKPARSRLGDAPRVRVGGVRGYAEPGRGGEGVPERAPAARDHDRTARMRMQR